MMIIISAPAAAAVAIIVQKKLASGNNDNRFIGDDKFSLCFRFHYVNGSAMNLQIFELFFYLCLYFIRI